MVDPALNAAVTINNSTAARKAGVAGVASPIEWRVSIQIRKVVQ